MCITNGRLTSSKRRLGSSSTTPEPGWSFTKKRIRSDPPRISLCYARTDVILCYLMLSKKGRESRKKTSNIKPSHNPQLFFPLKKNGARRFCRRLRRSPPSQAAGAAPVIFWAEKCQMFSGNFIWLGHIGLHPCISCRYLNSSTWNDHWDYIDYTLDYITLYCTVMSSFYHRLTCRSGAVSTRTCSPRAPTAGKKTKKQPPESIKKVAKGTKYLNI